MYFSKWKILFSVLIFYILVENCLSKSNSAIENKLSRMARKLNKIDRKLGILSSEQSILTVLDGMDRRLDDIETKLDTLLRSKGTTRMTTTALDTSEEEEEEVKEDEEGEYRDEEKTLPDINCVEIISVERSAAATGNNFTVRYRKNVDGIIIHVKEENNPFYSLTLVVEESAGVWAVSVHTTRVGSHYPFIWLMFGDRFLEAEGATVGQRYMVSLRLNNSDSTPQLQRVGWLPTLHVHPDKYAIFKLGENITVNALVSAPNASDLWITTGFSGIDLLTKDYYMSFYNFRDLIEEDDQVGSDERVGRNITVLTGVIPVVGYLQVYFSMETGAEKLVQTIQVSRYIQIKPSGMLVTIPSGYLSIAHQPYLRNENGTETTSCVGHECLQSCFAVGKGISSMSVQQLLPNGTTVTVDDAKEERIPDSPYYAVYWKFRAERSSGDEDGVTHFRCQAHDNSTQETVSSVQGVLAVIPPEIIRGRMVIDTRSGDHMAMDFDHLQVTLVCAAIGRPTPQVHFYDGQDSWLERAPDKTYVLFDTQTRFTWSGSLPTDFLVRLYGAEAILIHNGLRGRSTVAPPSDESSLTFPKCVLFSPYSDEGKVEYEFRHPVVA